MTRKLRTVLVAVMLLGLVAGGFGSAAADSVDANDSVINDDDVGDADNSGNGNGNANNVNVLGFATQDSQSLGLFTDDGGILG